MASEELPCTQVHGQTIVSKQAQLGTPRIWYNLVLSAIGRSQFSRFDTSNHGIRKRLQVLDLTAVAEVKPAQRADITGSSPGRQGLHKAITRLKCLLKPRVPIAQEQLPDHTLEVNHFLASFEAFKAFKALKVETWRPRNGLKIQSCVRFFKLRLMSLSKTESNQWPWENNRNTYIIKYTKIH